MTEQTLNLIMPPLENHALWKLAEECAELVQVCSKISRFGIGFHHPVTGQPNIDALIEECADVLNAIDRLKIDPDVMAMVRQHKAAKHAKWIEQELKL